MPELRKDIITGNWVIVATERAKRPENFSSKKEESGVQARPSYKPDCPFCPGHEKETPPEVFSYRTPGTPPDTEGWRVRVVPNKFPALSLEGDLQECRHGLCVAMPAVGVHQVIIETPRHDASPAELAPGEFAEVLKTYRERYRTLAEADPRLEYVLVFRNHGRPAGASLEHPHSQVSAMPFIPPVVEKELAGAHSYRTGTGRCVYCDIIKEEVENGERVVAVENGFVVLEPYASRVPFETWVLPEVHSSRFASQGDMELEQLALVMVRLLDALSRSLGDPAYNYVVHTAPCRGNSADDYYHWHIEILPKLSIQAGFEIGTGMYINVARPEDTARFLRDALKSG
ncbi:MAG TPA: galactose-1-phosphate uridylyltransferase [Firmicutes bacterium]|nr:galactose-1-phosphate uridylyltransferase [Bacillota bacterium]